jgi:hypothetical protein
MRFFAAVMQGKPDFTTVAEAIAKTKPPPWLAPALASFRPFVGTDQVPNEDYQRHQIIKEHMLGAAETLIKYLPAFMHSPIDIGLADEAAIAIPALTKIKAYLDRSLNQPGRGGGPRPFMQRKVCAAVVVEAWALIRGKAQPRSNRLYHACNEYWQACGHEYRSESWREDVEDAIREPQRWVRDVLNWHLTQARLSKSPSSA